MMTAKTSDDYRPCVCIYPDGKIRKANILYVRLDSLEGARRKLKDDKAAWLSYEDYDRYQADGGA